MAKTSEKTTEQTKEQMAEQQMSNNRTDQTTPRDIVIERAALVALVEQIFTAQNADPDTANTVAEHLVEANLKGHDSHGVGMIPAYVANLKAELLKPKAGMKVLRDNGAVVMIDGQYGFGQRVGKETTEFAIERAKEIGLVCVGLRNAHHLGRIGTYGEQCAAAGLISTHYVNVVGHAPVVSPFGSRDARMITNPFCAVVPRRDGPPVILDMATSQVAMGKVRVAYHKGQPVPPGALVDHEGLPTTDAKVLYEEPRGTLGPFGGHKGYGLAMLCELLGGALAGEWTMQPANPRSQNIVNNMLMFVLNPEATGNAEGFQDEVTAMVDYLHSATPAADTDKVRVPGDPERESRATRMAQGIPIDGSSWGAILQAAASAGLSAETIAGIPVLES